MPTAEEKWKAATTRLSNRIKAWILWIRIHWWQIIYVLVAIVVTLGLFVAISNSGRTWTALVVLLVLIRFDILFYQRWFRSSYSSLGPYSANWPPIINMCPDYLIYYNKDGEDTCIDLIGVSTGNTLRPWTEDETPENPPRDTNKYFPHVYKVGANIPALQKATANAGLTWEGIVGTDGGTNGCPITTSDGESVCDPNANK
jgi:hypothetical protein